ncbi:MAG: hypothetical protein ABR559_02440 [Gemmatimonadota bacterium]
MSFLDELGMLFVLATIALGVSVAALGGFALVTGRRHWVPRLLIVGVGWVVLYGATLAAASVTSAPRVLEPGTRMAFCGVYFDCHVGVEITQVRQAIALGAGANRVTPEGVFTIVTLRYSSDALRATLGLEEPDAVLLANDKDHLARSGAGERALNGTSGLFGRSLAPGESYAVDIVYDVPTGATNLRLHVRPSNAFERFSELFLIGDPESLFHASTTLRLPPPTPVRPPA